MIFYWEKQYRDALIPFLTSKNLTKEELDQLQ